LYYTGIDSSCKEVESSWHSIRNSISLDSTGILTFSLPNLLKYSTGFHWIPLDSGGIHWNPAGTGGGHERPLIFTGPRSPARVCQSLPDSGGLNRTLAGLVPYITKIGNFFLQNYRPFLADYKSKKIM